MTFFQSSLPPKDRMQRLFTWGDIVVLLLLVVLLYGGARLAFFAPEVIAGRDISTDPSVLPRYALFSLGRMAAAYALSLLFTIFYGRAAAYNRSAERVLMPLLDVLQSVPILSFLPVVLLSLSAILPQSIAAELASIVLIFTSQVWNMTFGWYQSLTTIPKELREASAIFRLNTWLRFKQMELPFGMISLLWNSMMSWAGGWFFLMAAEIFTVGERDFRLPGLGAYLHEAANQGDVHAILWGVATLVLVIILLDQFIWRPLLSCADRFKVEMVESDHPPTSWFYNVIHNSRVMNGLRLRLTAVTEALDAWLVRRAPMRESDETSSGQRRLNVLVSVLLAVIITYGAFRATLMLWSVPLAQWGQIGLGLLATLIRVVISPLIALAWTIPVGVITDGASNTPAAVEQSDTDPAQWMLEVDIADLSNRNELYFTLIHEFAHLLTLGPNQVPPDLEIYRNPDNAELYERQANTCPTYFPGEGCSLPNAYIYDFYTRFWTDLLDEWQPIDALAYSDDVEAYYDELYAFYERHQDAFVSDYAATNPSEDIAETFAYFIFSPRPAGNTEAEQKILFFYDYPELVTLRAEILSRFCDLAKE